MDYNTTNMFCQLNRFENNNVYKLWRGLLSLCSFGCLVVPSFTIRSPPLKMAFIGSRFWLFGTCINESRQKKKRSTLSSMKKQKNTAQRGSCTVISTIQGISHSCRCSHTCRQQSGLRECICREQTRRWGTPSCGMHRRVNLCRLRSTPCRAR